MPRLPTLAILSIAASLLLLTPRALAHGPDGHHDDGPHWMRWSYHLPIILALSGVSLAYALGLRRLWGSAGIGRGVSVRQAGAFAAGIAALVAALLSPIDGLSEELGWVHMIQHMILMMVAAPLVIVGGGGVAMMWVLPARARRRVGELAGRFQGWRVPRYLLWQPMLTFALFAVALWIWHVPALYEAALRSRLVHDIQHIVFFVAACLFWRVLLDPLSRLRLSPGLGVLYLFGTSMHATFLGVFMALAPTVWYPTYKQTTAAYSVTALEDQQLAGLIMWMPMCMIYAVFAAVILGLWLRDDREDVAAPA